MGSVIVPCHLSSVVLVVEPSSIWIMEKKMETLGPFKRIYRVIWGLYRDNGKENGNYHIIIGYILGL